MSQQQEKPGKSMVQTMEIFRTGTHTDSAGRTRAWTSEDLDKIVRAYNEQTEHVAPIVIGHPAANHPAWGWVKRLTRAGDRVIAEVDKLVPEFVEAVRAGRYRMRSASFYADGLLRHVGFLGGQPPAVKGLGDVEFAENADTTIEFTEDFRYQFQRVRSILSRLRDWIIETKDLETADRVIGPWELDMIVPEAPVPASYHEPITPQNGDPMPDINPEMQARLAQLEADNAALRQQNDQLTTTQRIEAHRSFMESAEMRRKLPAAARAEILTILSAIDGQEMDFSENGTTSRVSAAQRLRTVLSTLPDLVEFGEVAKTPESTPAPTPDLLDAVKQRNAALGGR